MNYSIIIPHKNTPILLQRCLDSIPRRQDIQIIVVDDNSDPKKVDFANFPCIKDPLVEIYFSGENKGAGYSRNLGIKNAKGSWLVFADADDFFLDGFLDVFDKYKDSCHDLVYFNTQEIITQMKGENKKIIKSTWNDNSTYFSSNKNKYEKYIYTSFVPWGKMIKKSLVIENKIKFDETMVANDKIFSLQVAHNAKNIFFDEHIIYTYERCYGSLTSTKTLEANFERLCVYIRINAFLEKCGKQKYRINIFKPLIVLIDRQNMSYFFNGIKAIKKNNVNMVMEFLGFLISLPFRLYTKLKQAFFTIESDIL